MLFDTATLSSRFFKLVSCFWRCVARASSFVFVLFSISFISWILFFSISETSRSLRSSINELILTVRSRFAAATLCSMSLIKLTDETISIFLKETSLASFNPRSRSFINFDLPDSKIETGEGGSWIGVGDGKGDEGEDEFGLEDEGVAEAKEGKRDLNSRVMEVSWTLGSVFGGGSGVVEEGAVIGTDDVNDVEVWREFEVEGGGEEGGVGTEEESEREGPAFGSGTKKEEEVTGTTAADEIGVGIEFKLDDESREGGSSGRISACSSEEEEGSIRGGSSVITVFSVTCARSSLTGSEKS